MSAGSTVLLILVNVHLFSFGFVILAGYLPLFFFLIFSKDWLCFIGFYLSLFWFLVLQLLPSVLADSWYWSGKGRGWGAPHPCQGDLEVQGPTEGRLLLFAVGWGTEGFHWHYSGGSLIRSWWGWKSRVPTWPSLTQSRRGGLGCLTTVLWAWKSRLPTWSLLLWVEEGPQCFLWCLARSRAIIFWKVSGLLGCPFLVLWLEEGSFHQSFVCIHWCFLVAGFFTSQSGIHETKIKPREPTTVLSLGSQEP